MCKISVCIATYNGDKWIQEQLDSILIQLSPNDEIIIIDDGSKDETCSIISAYKDGRIRLFENSINSGVDCSFEEAISRANGDVIFLSDQDDIWYSKKIENVMREFEDNPMCTLVISDADIINNKGSKVGSTYFQKRGGFAHGVFSNLLKSKFLGCTIAFKSSIRTKFLPFPSNIPGHDMWIGLINEYYGCSCFISTPLIGYRRHGENLSPDKHKGLFQMIIWRWSLLKSLFYRILFIYFRS